MEGRDGAESEEGVWTRVRFWRAILLRVLVIGAVLALAWACNPEGGSDTPDGKVPPSANDGGNTPDGTDAGDDPDGGDPGDGGDPDGGQTPDAGEPTDDAGTPVTGGPGPWPIAEQTDLSATFELGAPRSVGLDEAMNLWLLDGDRIGLLRPGETRPTWTKGVGQAAGGFGREQKALDSTVICGGEAGRAYVGYYTYDLSPSRIEGPYDEGYDAVRFEEFQKGDLDAVRFRDDGTVVLEEHLWRSVGSSQGPVPVGLRNTNDWHYDEDRSIFTCKRVVRGPQRGDLYIGTNHGVTRIQGLLYNSHRHVTWTEDRSLRAGYTYGLGIAPNGDVLVANDWKVGILIPSADLREWDRELTWDGPTPWRYMGHNTELNSLAEFDFWRGFEQTADGSYFLGSRDFGLWRLEIVNRSTGLWTRVPGVPGSIQALQATDDGSLYVGTDGSGLWRVGPDGSAARVEGVPGDRIRQLVYEPNLEPSMLLVVTGSGVILLRGP